MHFNPVKHGYVTQAVDWPYSSIHSEIANGNITEDWGCVDGGNETFDTVLNVGLMKR